MEQWLLLLDTYMQSCDFDGVEKTVKKFLEASPSDSKANDIYAKLQDWKFCEIKNGVLVKYCGRAKDILIPYGVTSIGVSAFEGKDDLISITIPDSVTRINDRAFRGCSSLTAITIPGSVSSIESFLFEDCHSLISVILSRNAAEIPMGMFARCSSLSSISIPNSVNSIGRQALDCQHLFRQLF